MTRSLRLLIAVVLVGFVAACVTGCAVRQSEATGEEYPPSAEVRTLGLPFDAASASLAAMYTVLDAQDWLTRACMKTAGQDWKVIARPTALEDLRNRRRYGVVEMSIAERFGYHVPTGLLTPSAVEQAYDARDKSLNQAQRRAVSGPKGCGAQASREFASQRIDYRPLARMDRTSLYGALRRPAVAEALRSWQQCMSDKGLRYRSPLSAISDPRWSDASAGPSALERSVAVADVRCKSRSRLVEVWHAAEVDMERAMMRRHPAYFHRLHASVVRDVSHARAILARST